MFKWRVQTPPLQRRAGLTFPVQRGGKEGYSSEGSGRVPNLDPSCLSSVVTPSLVSGSSLVAHASDIDLEINMDGGHVLGDDTTARARAKSNNGVVNEGCSVDSDVLGDSKHDYLNRTDSQGYETYGVGFESFSSDAFGDLTAVLENTDGLEDDDYEDDFTDDEDVDEEEEECSPMLPAASPRKLMRYPRIDEDDGYGDSFDTSGQTEDGKFLIHHP